jgi:hypothetical protein
VFEEIACFPLDYLCSLSSFRLMGAHQEEIHDMVFQENQEKQL